MVSQEVLKSSKSKLCENCIVEQCNDRYRGQVIYCSLHTTKPIQTNADRIRAMSDEELARFLAGEIPHGDCYGCNLECATFEGDKFVGCCHNAFYRWLKQPVEVSGDA